MLSVPVAIAGATNRGDVPRQRKVVTVALLQHQLQHQLTQMQETIILEKAHRTNNSDTNRHKNSNRTKSNSGNSSTSGCTNGTDTTDTGTTGMETTGNGNSWNR